MGLALTKPSGATKEQGLRVIGIDAQAGRKGAAGARQFATVDPLLDHQVASRQAAWHDRSACCGAALKHLAQMGGE